MTKKNAKKAAARARQSKHGGKYAAQLRIVGGGAGENALLPPPSPPPVPPDPYEEVFRRAAVFMQRRTVAFWGHHDEYTKGEPRQYGTGVLLQIADVKFILTAEHVAEMFLRHGVPLVIAATAERLTPLTKAHVRHSKKGDIAIIVLTEEDAAKIGPEKQFVRMSEVLAQDHDDDGWFYGAFGYPSETSDVDHSAKLMTMYGTPCFGNVTDGKGLMAGFRGDAHLAIEFDPARHPHPGGMSGGGMWRVYHPGMPPERWSEDDVKLVAIEHTLGAGHTALIGTHIEYVLGLIRSYDPTLERAFNLLWPKRKARGR